MESIPAESPPQAPEKEEQPQPGPAAAPTGYLRLRGLPFSVGPGELVDWFSAAGFELVQTFICKRNGRSTGEAYVQLKEVADEPRVMESLNKQYLGLRYIELFASSEAELSTAKTLAQDKLRGFVVRMRGLPYSASATDVLKFLDGIEVVRGMEGVIFTWTPDGRPTGEAFVELKDEEAQREAMKRHKELMGNRYIELFTSTKADLIQAIQHNRLILGFATRKRWLQQAGLGAAGMMGPFPGPAGPQAVAAGMGLGAPVMSGPGGVRAPYPMAAGRGAGMAVGGRGFRPPAGPANPRFMQPAAGRGVAQPLGGRGAGMGGLRPQQPSGYGMPMGQPGAGQALLVQQPYILQQPGQQPQMTGLMPPQEYYAAPQAQMQSGAGQYMNMAAGPTYTLAIQLPGEFQTGSLDMGSHGHNQMHGLDMSSLSAGDVVLKNSGGMVLQQ